VEGREINKMICSRKKSHKCKMQEKPLHYPNPFKTCTDTDLPEFSTRVPELVEVLDKATPGTGYR
jgi:hypothetical protein